MNREDTLNCPQCGGDADHLHEGYCKDCCDSNQSALDMHNIQFDRWSRLVESEQDNEIKRAYK